MWNIDDFIEIDSKERTKSGTKLYFYIPKEQIKLGGIDESSN